MSKAIASPAAVADWLIMLDGIERSVSNVLADVDKRASAGTQDVDHADGANRDAAFRSRLEATIRGLDERLTAARTLAIRVEALLDADEQMVRTWRQTAESARQRLAATAGI
jgi:hypothetical protein